MSDILEKLLGVEKSAGLLVSQAEAEAARRKAEAQAEVEKLSAGALKDQAVRADARIAAERAAIAAEREQKNGTYRESLAARAQNTEALRLLVAEFVEKGL